MNIEYYISVFLLWLFCLFLWRRIGKVHAGVDRQIETLEKDITKEIRELKEDINVMLEYGKLRIVRDTRKKIVPRVDDEDEENYEDDEDDE